MNRGTWKNGKRQLKGWWIYYWPSDRFTVILDSIDRVTQQNKKITVYGDTPEWGKWKLVRGDSE